MTGKDIHKIRKLSEKFIRAIRKCDSSELPLSLADFPVESCSDASMLLGSYFKDNGLGDFDFVKGRRGQGVKLETHYWLQRNTLIVDITAFQFEGIDDEMLITNTDSEFHNSFEQKIIQQADYRLIEAPDVERHLHAVYEYIYQHGL